MVILRCTKKLLRRIGTSVAAADSTVRSTTRLGDWTANLLTFDRRQVVLAVSHATLLPVIFRLPSGKELEPSFKIAVYEMLFALEIHPSKIDSELVAMDKLAVGPTNDRRVLGIAVDYAREMDCYFDSPLLELAYHLADRPIVRAGRFSSPRDAVRDAFSAPLLRLVTS